MATDLEKLVLTIEARTAQFEKALKKATGETQGFSRRSGRAASQFGRRMQRLERDVKGATQRISKHFRTLTFAGGLGTGALSFGLKDALTDFDKIAKVADKVGLSTNALQELRYAGERTGVAVTAVDMAMQRFSRRLSEASQGNTALGKVLRANNVQLRDQAGNIRPLEDLLADYADVVASAESEQDQLRLAFIAQIPRLLAHGT